MGNYCYSCLNKDHSRSKLSEDFEIQKHEKSNSHKSSLELSKKSISQSIEEKQEMELSKELSSIDIYFNNYESVQKDNQVSTPDGRINLKNNFSLNMLNEFSDAEIGDFISHMLDTEDFSKANFTIGENSLFELTLKPGISENESFYRGESNSNGIPHGRGAKVDKNGKYFGYFYEGLPHGMGRLLKPSGDVYQGEFCKGKLHGNAMIMKSNGTIYEGNFEKGVLTGNGRETWTNGIEYEGEFFNNQKHGKGKLKFIDGSIYNGDFHSDRVCGKGKKTWKDNTSYYGDWINGLMHGYGELHFNDGKVFSGEFQNSLICGTGKLVFPDNRTVEGMWEQNPDGNLIFIDKKSSKKIFIMKNSSLVLKV